MKPRRNRLLLSVVAVILAAMMLAAVGLAQNGVHDAGEMLRITNASADGRDSRRASVSADGMLVTFHSDSDLLGQGIPDNQFEVWLYDTSTMTHTRVTTATAANRDSFSPRLSADGSTLIFYSDADFLNQNIPDGQNEVWLYDTAEATVTRVTVASDANRESWSEDVNADGSVVAFTSDSDFLAQGIADDQIEVWLHDTATMTHTRITTASDLDRESYSPRLNADGTLVVFSSDSDFLGQGIEDDQFEMWLYDVGSGGLTRITNAPDSSRGSFAPSLSADGTMLTFTSDVDILGEDIVAGQYEVWLYDINNGVFTRVTDTAPGRLNDFPVLNADGTRLAFHSDADFLDDGDILDGQYEVWLYDVPNDSLTRVTTGSEPFRKSLQPNLTAGGDKVVFESSSDFLGQGVDNEEYEIWLFSLPLPNPGLTKSVDDAAPQPGQRITYTLVVDNPLDVGLTNGVISDTLPAGLTFAGPVTLEPPQASADLAGDAHDLPNLAAALKIPAKSAITVTFPVTVDDDVDWSTLITNVAGFTCTQVPTPTFGTVAVDVRFQVTSVSPPSNSNDAPLDAPLSFTANDTIDTRTVTTQSFTVHGGFQGFLNGTLVFGSIIVDSGDDFLPGALVQASVTAGVRSVSGTTITPYVWTFRAATTGGTGAFEPHPVTPALPTYQSIGVGLGDLDGDGDLDAVLANGSYNPESVWLNDGTGALAPHPSTPAFGAGTSRDVALGDLDGDGDLDAVVANAITDTVWLNNGGGTFMPHPATSELGTESSRRVVLGDLDGDGDLDAVFAHFNFADTVWLNDGAGALTPHPAAAGFGVGSSFDISLGDLDGDGDLDALVTKTNLPDTIWLNDGTGVFAYRGTFGTGTSYGLATGDLDGDGDLDAVVAKGGGLPETVWLGDGSGRMVPHPVTPAFGAADSLDVELGDVDGDGDLDAVVANGVGQAQTTWLNDGAGNFAAHPDTPDFGAGSSSGLILGDLDGDGDLDVVVGDSSSLDVTVWLNANVYRIMLPLVMRDL